MSRNFYIKLICPACGYIVRTTRKWLDVGLPRCPNINCSDFGEEMEPDAGDKNKNI